MNSYSSALLEMKAHWELLKKAQRNANVIYVFLATHRLISKGHLLPVIFKLT